MTPSLRSKSFGGFLWGPQPRMLLETASSIVLIRIRQNSSRSEFFPPLRILVAENTRGGLSNRLRYLSVHRFRKQFSREFETLIPPLD